MIKIVRRYSIISLLFCLGNLFSQKELSFRINTENSSGIIRPLNGGQLSPVCNYRMLNLTEEFSALNIPLVRLHDAPWFNENVVDVHMIFPNFNLDPAKEENYFFGPTDAYLESILKTGTKVVFRLGESIEKTSVKYYVNPPADFSKWAQICCGIIRHYNEGWAKGFHHGIRYWEIWNEPDGSAATWNGTPEQFYTFYETAAKTIKKEFPDIMVGGPGMACPLKDENGTLVVTDWTKKFLEHCRSKSVPLDFFSWHDYCDDPFKLAKKPARVREMLNQYGFGKTESHLNEWNYIPGNEWERLFGGGMYQGARRRNAYENQSGPKGAAFVASVLMLLQNEPVDVANYYTTTAGMFGIFSEYGECYKTYYAFRAFAELLKTPIRLQATYDSQNGLAALAGINQEKTQINILLANFSSDIKFTWANVTLVGLNPKTIAEIRLIDISHNFIKIREMQYESEKNVFIREVLPSESVMLISLKTYK